MFRPISDTKGEGGPVSQFNPFKPGVLFMGHKQTEQSQIRRRNTRRPIWDYSVCLHDFHRKVKQKLKTTPNVPKSESGLIQMIGMGHSTRHKRVKSTR